MLVDFHITIELHHKSNVGIPGLLPSASWQFSSNSANFMLLMGACSSDRKPCRQAHVLGNNTPGDLSKYLNRTQVSLTLSNLDGFTKQANMWVKLLETSSYCLPLQRLYTTFSIRNSLGRCNGLFFKKFPQCNTDFLSSYLLPTGWHFSFPYFTLLSIVYACRMHLFLTT